jgi:hypothetical protein
MEARAMDEYMTRHDREYLRDIERNPRGERLTVTPMDANNLGQPNDFRELKLQPKKKETK